MKFGIFYEHQIPRPWDAGSEYRQYQNALSQVELADQLGFDYAWMVEHHFLEEYSHGSSPTAFLAAASQRTKRIRLGHGIFQLPTNHPIRVAEHVSTLDLLSGGRVELGTGEGAGPAELHPFGARVRRKREMWEEGIRALIPCFTQDGCEFHGEFWDFPRRNVLPKPYQKPHPPLWVACSNLSTIAMTAQRGMGALSFQFATVDGAHAWVNRYYGILQRGEVEPLCDYEWNPNLAAVSGFMCAETDAEARAKADGWTFFVFCLEKNATHTYEPGAADLWEEYQEWKGGEAHENAFESGLIGSPATIRAKLRDFAATGIDQIILLNQAGKNTHEDICSSLELFAREVMPEFLAMEDDHQAWKRDVLAGRIELEQLETRGVVTAVMAANPKIVRVTADQIRQKVQAQAGTGD
jgi:alkanesulfonate monooxygenase SsuD/methylene tetrahydromethanopterin reductase-like flavin-dependent oxidoreductase (luciferase family)